MSRPDHREANQLRPVCIETNFFPYAEGSVLIRVGNTHVAVSASVEERTPRWMRGKGKGWVTAEYSMLPRATHERTQREVTRGKASGRTQEIQRLIGRSLRAVIDLSKLGEHTIWIDCDVIRADGGTRTASITGAYVAVCLAIRKLMDAGKLKESPMRDTLAAVSVGIVDDTYVLDLAYEEDSRAQVDMNVVMTGSGDMVEIQGTAEDNPFPRKGLDTLLNLAQKGVDELCAVQRAHIPEGVVR